MDADLIYPTIFGRMTWDNLRRVAVFAYTVCGLMFWPLTIAVVEKIALVVAPTAYKRRIEDLGDEMRGWAIGLWFCGAALFALYNYVGDFPAYLRSQQCRFDPSC